MDVDMVSLSQINSRSIIQSEFTPSYARNYLCPVLQPESLLVLIFKKVYLQYAFEYSQINMASFYMDVYPSLSVISKHFHEIDYQ